MLNQNSVSNQLVANSLQNAYSLLTNFANQPDFFSKISLIFGEGFDTAKLEDLRSQ